MNNNVKNIEISGIRKFYNEVVKYDNALSLTLGQPDFNVPNAVKMAMIKALEDNKTEYTANAGLVELREEICNYLNNLNIKYKVDEVCVTVGGSEGLYSAFQAILNPGEIILIPSIAYPAYKAIGDLIGAKVIEYKLKDDFTIDIEHLKKLLEENNVKAMVVSYPSNPTGALMTKELRDELYNVVKDEEMFIVSDEIYASLCYEEEYYSISQYGELKDRIIFVGGFSKMFSMTGLRVGFVCGVKDVIREITKVHQYNVSCAASVAQYGALEGLRSSMNDVEYMRQEFEKRRDFVYDKLLKLGFHCNKPKGAFYIFPSIKKFGMKSEEFCMKLLSEEKVACVPGNAFGKSGDEYMRISYSYSIEQLEDALSRIESFINKL